MRIGANATVFSNASLVAGRDLLLISQQNQSTSNSWSFDVSVTHGVSETGEVGLTGFSLAGAGMCSKTGKLKLDTNDLVFDNYSNKDAYVVVSGGISLGAKSPLGRQSVGALSQHPGPDLRDSGCRRHQRPLRRLPSAA